MTREQWILLIMFILFANFIPIFIDPFLHGERVTLVEWVKREVHELMYGEK